VAKKQDLTQGFAQLFIEMYTAHRMNVLHGYHQDTFYGILSTAEVWYFVEYRHGGNPPFRYLNLSNDGLLLDLLNTLYAFLLNIWVLSLDTWFQSRVIGITKAVASDVDPAPDNSTNDSTLDQLRDQLVTAITKNKSFVHSASLATTNEQAADPLNFFPLSNVRIKSLIYEWNHQVIP